MAMLKSITAKVRSCKKVQRYLERDGRAEDVYVSDALGADPNWGAAMDRDRRIYSPKDKGVRWYHFVISPDPADFPTVDDVMELARKWAEEQYPGRQYAIAIHSDNKNEVRHAHVILNSFDPVKWKKIQRSDAKVQDEALTLQLLSQELGLAPMRDIREKRMPEQKSALTKAEREMLSKGIIPYKEAMRRAIREVAPASSDFQDFQKKLEERGITAKVTRSGITYYDARGRAAKDRKLGADFCRAALETVFIWKMPGSGAVYTERLSGRRAHIGEFRNAIAKLERRASSKGVRRAKDIAEMIEILSASKMPAQDAFEEKIEQARGLAGEAREAIAEAEAQVSRLAAANERFATLLKHGSAYEQYKLAGRHRRRVQKQYAEEIEAYADAASWLDARGISKDSGIEIAELYESSRSELARIKSRYSSALSYIRHAEGLYESYLALMHPLSGKATTLMQILPDGAKAKPAVLARSIEGSAFAKAEKSRAEFQARYARRVAERERERMRRAQGEGISRSTDKAREAERGSARSGREGAGGITGRQVR